MKESHKRSRNPAYKTKYRVTNWPQYEQSLRNRGSLTLWISPSAMKVLHSSSVVGNKIISWYSRSPLVFRDWMCDHTGMNQKKCLKSVFCPFHSCSLFGKKGCAYLRRRTSSHSRDKRCLKENLDLFQCYYNFIRPHSALILELRYEHQPNKLDWSVEILVLGISSL